jgi:serine kinase of HPr protein (carbohydrate metabolism regulator)
MTALSSETVHASTVSIGGRAVLISGRPGSGKSDLALRLIDRGAVLVSDDYTIVSRSGKRLLASAPETIRGRIEVRGLGLVDVPHESSVPVALVVDIDEPVPRMPEPGQTRIIANIAVPLFAVAPHEASAPIKVEQILKSLAAA